MTQTEDILAERKKTHGEYYEHARATQKIVGAVSDERNWSTLTPIMLETVHMIAHKLGRIATGDPSAPDHWLDIAGYATLVHQRLTEPDKYPTDEWRKQPIQVKRRTSEGRAYELGDPNIPNFVAADTPYRHPEDGSQHASVYPWVVTSKPDASVAAFYMMRSPNVYVLETSVQDTWVLPVILTSIYHKTGYGNALLNIEKCPPDARDYFPYLSTEYNSLELDQLGDEWKKELYRWDEDKNKFLLTDSAWARD